MEFNFSLKKFMMFKNINKWTMYPNIA